MDRSSERTHHYRYRAIVSSDWNECLAPCGPFDFIAYAYPELADALGDVFRQYTGNRLPLGRAMERIREMTPAPVGPEQMDAYIDSEFRTYKGVTDLMEWCRSKEILFMINTTGVIGYFQRVLAKRLIPPIPCLSAHPGVRYPKGQQDPDCILELHEVADKGRHTQKVIRSKPVKPGKIILLGDSGGDGPHFAWGFGRNAYLIGSMTKASLADYCRENGVEMQRQFGLSYRRAEKPRREEEMTFDFRDLIPMIAEIAGVS